MSPGAVYPFTEPCSPFPDPVSAASVFSIKPLLRTLKDNESKYASGQYGLFDGGKRCGQKSSARGSTLRKGKDNCQYPGIFTF
ncbi:hypothetical protein KQX54_017913 [Cotesia glomerata]|uniref:Uncharacterized protein n=1 Tax=Cotesia glomerata TaxID=32391 RepID=A0AAV7IJG4_COTGL|nr:hypothetical protein KQX54_017913 [Cotesia glomerata]